MEDLKHEQEQKTESAQTQESAHSEPVALNMDALKHQATQNTANAKTNQRACRKARSIASRRTRGFGH